MIAAVAVTGQWTTTALEVGGADVIEHQHPVLQVPPRQAVLDPPLALDRPIQRRVGLVLLIEDRNIHGALYHPNDGHIAPADVTMAMAKGARALGAMIHQGTEVRGFERLPSGEWKVLTNQGTIICEHVVLATGNYARQTGAMLGLEVPAIPLVVQYWITDPVPEIIERKRKGLPEMPIVRDEGCTGYMREEGDSLLFGAYEKPEDLELFAVDGVPEGFDGELMPANFDGHAANWELAMQLAPVLGRVGIKRNIRGPMQMTADELPLCGPAPGLRNVWMAEGVPGGILWGGALGHYLSEQIVEGGASLDMSELDPRRFGDYATKEWTKLKVLETWGTHADTHFPDQNLPAGRPGKTAPSFDPPERHWRCLGYVQRLGDAELVCACRCRSRWPRQLPTA